MFDSEKLINRSIYDIFQMYLKVGFMFIRGLWWRIWINSTNGLILIGSRVKIRNSRLLSVGKNFIAEDYCEIHCLSLEGIIVGDNVSIGRFAMIRPSGYYGREIGVGLEIGSDSSVGPYCYIGCGGGIKIGNNVMLSPRVSLHSENHIFVHSDIPIKEQGVTKSPIIIEDNCWIASSSVILSGVTIGKGSIVAAGAVITKDVEPLSVVGGIPAEVIGKRPTSPSKT